MGFNMKKYKIIFAKIICKLIAKHLSDSYSPMNKYSWWLRGGKLILKKCGKNIAIGRNAVFSEKVSLGNNSGIGTDCCLYGEIYIGDNVLMEPEVCIYT